MAALLIGLRGKTDTAEEKKRHGSPLPWYVGVFVMNGLSDAKETIASDLKSNGRQAEKALERLIRDFKD